MGVGLDKTADDNMMQNNVVTSFHAWWYEAGGEASQTCAGDVEVHLLTASPCTVAPSLRQCLAACSGTSGKVTHKATALFTRCKWLNNRDNQPSTTPVTFCLCYSASSINKM